MLIVTLAFGLITSALRAGAPDGVEICRRAVFAAPRASLSIYVVFFATIAAAIFLPDVVLWLPKQAFPESVGCFKNPSGAGYICP